MWQPGHDLTPAAPMVVLIVAYRPDLQDLSASLSALRHARANGLGLEVMIWHNDAGAEDTPGLQSLVEQTRKQGLPIAVHVSAKNLGFGQAINHALTTIRSPWLLLLNQDAIPEPGTLETLARQAFPDAPGVAAWELRQIPYEHPKDYDPVSGETGWFSGAAVLLRTEALREVGGFEPRFFMYGEDVDLSWRLRCAGWRLRYLPRCAVVHRTYRYPGEAKPLAVLGGAYANLCIRTRFAGRRHVLDGLRDLWRRGRHATSFAGERPALARVALKFAINYPYFRRTRTSAPGFIPCFNGTDYEMRREGAFHPFLSADQRPQTLPLVTAVVNAKGLPTDLDEWLASIANQTHRPLQVLVNGGNEAGRRPVCEAWAGTLDVRPLPATAATPEAVAAVHAETDWCLSFQDEGVLAYADHTEVLLQAALGAGMPGAVALHWIVHLPPGGRREAHRQHAPRVLVDGSPLGRPSRLVHRSSFGQPETAQPLLPVEKLTTLRYTASVD